MGEARAERPGSAEARVGRRRRKSVKSLTHLDRAEVGKGLEDLDVGAVFVLVGVQPDQLRVAEARPNKDDAGVEVGDGRGARRLPEKVQLEPENLRGEGVTQTT
jgi:hypothetical protein